MSRSKPGLAGSTSHAGADEIRLFVIVNIHPAGGIGAAVIQDHYAPKKDVSDG
jgi:hypothetical protein